jgi:hypothetical protein
MKIALRTLGCISIGLAVGCTVVEEPSFLGDPGTGDGEFAVVAPAGDPPLTDVNEPTPLDAEGCPGLYSQEHLPRFDLEIHPAVMASLYEDWVQGRERNSLDEDDTPYHPLAELRYGNVVITDAKIRLRGNPVFWLEQNKMQFQISFDENDKNGRFLGLRKVLFDASTFNRHFLRDRLSLYVMRQAGVAAPCANNALIYINGEYYGLFTNLEKLDDVFLTRVFPGSDQGDLWKRRNWELKTNVGESSSIRLNALLNAADEVHDGANGNVIALEQYLDIEQALRVYAIDAVIPNSDGPWAGGLNFYLYDHPGLNKFVLLPWDLDNTFDRVEPTVDPITFRRDVRYHGRAIFHTILKSSYWRDRYVDLIDELLNGVYVHQDLWQLAGNDQNVPLGELSPTDMINLGVWSVQIREAALADINKPYTNNRMEDRRQDFSQFIRDREVFLRGWVCDQKGGTLDPNGACVVR